jgi:D-arabinose 1-dehydrogenase-like Zn-dependent alcohol dehydrogenase
MQTKIARIPAQNGSFEIAEVELASPGPGHVLVAVEACGICHSDSLTVNNGFGNIQYPRAPGHEIAGRIEALGDGVLGWNVGDRVGIGWHGGHCGYCDRCRRGDFITCRRMQVPGMAYDGGYGEYVVAPAVALAKIPDALTAVEAAPLMCAGVTTYNALRHSGALPGDLVAIHGIGGLGHLGVQFANKMGFETVAIARGEDKGPLAKQLGAHHYLDSNAGDVARALKKLGGARTILATVTNAQAMASVVGGLGYDGVLVIVGVAIEPLPLATAMMIGGRQSVLAWPSGTCADSEDTMKFCALTGIRAMVETIPLARAQEGYDKMMNNAARFRMVLTV